jgi:hypothetical protein
MNTIDLNLHNYELKDLLKLFKLKMNFNENDLKEAKKLVLLVHPDKSGLDSKYFIFYKKAYDLLCNIYEVNHKSTNTKVTNVSYDTLTADYKQSDRSKAVQSIKNTKDFNKHFNKLFDEHYTKDENGHGDWLKEETEALSYNQLKQQSRELALRTEVQELAAKSNYTELDNPQSYSSDQFMDLREAYTTGSVIGVDEHLDFDKVKKYKSVEELKNERSIGIKPLSSMESQHIINQRYTQENEKGINRVYQMTMEREQHLKKQDSFWSKFLSIKM